MWQIGSVCAYPERVWLPAHEEDLWCGFPEVTNGAYGVSKRALVSACDAHRSEYGLRAISLLPVNLYGPGDNFDTVKSHVVPALIRKFIEARDANSENVVLWGTGQPTREFLYSADCAEGVVLATERYDKAGPVNLGSGQETKIIDLANLIAEEVEFKGGIIFDASKPEGQMRRTFDITKAKEEFGFVAQTSLRKGIRKTIEWYEAQRCAR